MPLLAPVMSMTLPSRLFIARPSQFLVVSVDLAVISEVIEGSEAQPYLCLQIELDPIQLADVLLQVSTSTHGGDEGLRGIFVGEADTRFGDSPAADGGA